MEIRKLKTDDFFALRDLLDGVFSRKYENETRFEALFPRIFTQPNEYCTSSHWGAFDGDRLVGTAAMYPVDYVVGGVHIRLIGNGNVAVHEDYRGQGVMTKILNKINEECDKVGDVGYLHGSVERYSKFGYLPCGVQYLCSFEEGENNGYEFAAMRPEDIPWHMACAASRSDYVVRSEKEFIPALRSQSREAVSVFKNGNLVGYISLARKVGKVEEFAAANGDEAGIFRSLVKELDRQITVRLSGYDVKTLDRIKGCAEVSQSEPALFRIINSEPLKEGALALGLGENIIYAPYFT